MTPDPESVLEFWFGDDLDSAAAVEARARQWFEADAAFDDRIRERFSDLPARAQAGELDGWRGAARSSLALVLVLDQLPRNLHRDSARSFAYDPLAHEACVSAIAHGFDAQLEPLQAMFLYLPLEHAEDVESQRRCVSLLRALVARAPSELRPRFESFLDYGIRHQQVIERFGRFPHRNAVLGRTSTPAELSHLESGGDAFGVTRDRPGR